MIRQTASIGIGVIGALSMMAIVGVSAGATNAPVIKVKPHTGLGTTATVMVSGRNLGDNKTVTMVECDAKVLTEGGCNLENTDPTNARTSSTGSLAKTAYLVDESFPTTRDGTVNCATGQDQCVIWVVAIKTQKSLGTVPLTFAS
jgi:hypothetical protein